MQAFGEAREGVGLCEAQVEGRLRVQARGNILEAAGVRGLEGDVDRGRSQRGALARRDDGKLRRFPV